MSKPRVLVPNGVHHLGSRGSSREWIVWDDDDRDAWVRGLGKVAPKYGWRVLAWCLMGNHFHLVLRDPECSLSDGMRVFNGSFARRTNARHGRDAHLYKNRFWSRLIETDEHLLTVFRYNDLNPVEEGLCERPADWPWSSHACVIGERPAPPWLAVDEVLRLFGRDRSEAIARYRDFVERGIGRIGTVPWSDQGLEDVRLSPG